MADKLDEIFTLQKSLERMMNLDRYPKDTEAKLSALCDIESDDTLSLY